MQFTTGLTVEGVAASFVVKTSVFAYRSFLVPDLNFFPVKMEDHILKSNWFLIHRRDRYLTKYTICFFEEILRIASFVDQIPIENILSPDTSSHMIGVLRDPSLLIE